MATHKAAKKKHIQDEKRRSLNRWHRSRMRTQIKRLRKAIADGDVAGATGLLGSTLCLVDRTAKHGVIHDNAASRTKSRLTRAVQGMSPEA